MKRVVIFGNSGSGKSTHAKKLCATQDLAHLDLDTIAWKTGSPPQRRSITDSQEEIEEFLTRNSTWVIEGCYSDLLELVIPQANEVIFLDLPVNACIANAKARPWEPHKYKSKKAQDANLSMLLNWIAEYPNRQDTFSRTSHLRLWRDFHGSKVIYNSNDQIGRT